MDTPADTGSSTLGHPKPHYEATTKTEILGFSRSPDPEIEPDTRRRWSPAPPRARQRCARVWFALLYVILFMVGVAGIWFICAHA